MGALLAGCAGIAAALLLSRHSEAVDLLRFPLCWASLLVALHGAVRLRHGRAAVPPARELALLGLGSVLFWDLFELLNLQLHDWWYVGVPRSAAAGALFGAASFATVLPAVRLAELLLRSPRPVPAGDPVAALVAGSPRVADGPAAPAAAPAAAPVRPGRLAAAGLLLLGLALAFPGAAFPLAWVFLLPLCEAALCLWPCGPGELRGPLEALRAGDRGAALRLLALGLPLGLLWEGFNWGCARGWVYTVPHFEAAKVFEMPAPGYLGYLPFLLEAGAANALLLRVRGRLRVGAVAGAALLVVLVLAHLSIDGAGREGSVVSVAPRLEDAQGLRAVHRLAAAGVETPRALEIALAREGPAGLARRASLDPAQLEEAERLASLARVAHLGVPWAERLLRAGVRSPADLSRADPVRLRGRLSAGPATDLRALALPRGGPSAGGDDGAGAPRDELLRLWMRSAARLSR